MKTIEAKEILEETKKYVSTYLENDDLPIIIAVADPGETLIGISIQRNYPLTLIDRSFGIPFGRFRSDAVKLLSDPDELHGYKWSIETHESVFEADAATNIRLHRGEQRRVPIRLSTGLGNVLQNLRSIAYIDRATYMVVGERPDQPPPYACLVEYSKDSDKTIGVELLLFNELGGCQRVDKARYLESPVKATSKDLPKYEDSIRWAVSGYPLILNGEEVSLELTTRNVSDFRHIWRLPKLAKSLVAHLAKVSNMPNAEKRIEFYFGFDEIREKRNFVLATKDLPLTLPLELAMPQEWVETMCKVCNIEEGKLDIDLKRHAITLDPDEVAIDFKNTDYIQVATKKEVIKRGQFYIDKERNEITVRFLPAIYPHHIVGLDSKGRVVNISICGLSGRSGITIEDAKKLCSKINLQDALVFDNGNDVFARYEGKHLIAHKRNTRKTRLTAALLFADQLDPGPLGLCDIRSDEIHVQRKKTRVRSRVEKKSEGLTKVNTKIS